MRLQGLQFWGDPYLGPQDTTLTKFCMMMMTKLGEENIFVGLITLHTLVALVKLFSHLLLNDTI